MHVPDDAQALRKGRLVIFAGIALLLVIAGIAIYGFYDKFVAPTQILAARVGDTTYTQGDLVKRMRMLQADSAARGQPLDFGRVPFEVLNRMTEAEIIRRFASEFNVRVTKADVNEGLFRRFAPSIPEGQDIRPGQEQQEYKENYNRFLENTHLSDKDYRRIVEEEIYRTRLREAMGEQVPSIDEQVEVHWIKLPSTPQAPGGFTGLGGPTGPTPDGIRQRLEEEKFGDIARLVSTDRRFSDNEGYVGWVPEGAFPSLDGALFGADGEEPLARNEISQPIYAPEGVYILKVAAGPQAQEISEIMRGQLTNEALSDWLLTKREIGAREGWLEVNFSSELYEWVNRKVREAAPPVTPRSESAR